MKPHVRSLFRGKYLPLSLLLLCVLLFSAGVDIFISLSAGGSTTGRMEELPFNRCGLLLGTSKFRADGTSNPFFSNRLDAAAGLYHAGKIDCIIATGDNSDRRYNEPRTMLAGLVERGVPANRVFPDYAGFRTLDSVVRAKEIFGQRSITVISQKFHNERAVYIGRHYGVDVYGYNAADSGDPAWFKVRGREVLARVRAFIDLHITGEKPRFLGERVDIR